MLETVGRYGLGSDTTRNVLLKLVQQSPTVDKRIFKNLESMDKVWTSMDKLWTKYGHRQELENRTHNALIAC